MSQSSQLFTMNQSRQQLITIIQNCHFPLITSIPCTMRKHRITTMEKSTILKSSIMGMLIVITTSPSSVSSQSTVTVTLHLSAMTWATWSIFCPIAFGMIASTRATTPSWTTVLTTKAMWNLSTSMSTLCYAPPTFPTITRITPRTCTIDGSQSIMNMDLSTTKITHMKDMAMRLVPNIQALTMTLRLSSNMSRSMRLLDLILVWISASQSPSSTQEARRAQAALIMKRLKRLIRVKLSTSLTPKVTLESLSPCEKQEDLFS